MAKLTREDVGRIVADAREVGGRPDFNGTDLSRMDLSGIDLTGARFSEANLSETIFTRADLSGAALNRATLKDAILSQAILSQADLTFANLNGADLNRTDLRRAKLNDTNLSEANLLETDLSFVNLNGADFSGAFLTFTTFGSIDLRPVKGLDSVNHYGPSIIGTHTLTASQGQIPEIFLRGCGLSDVDIEYAKLHNPNLSQDQIIDIIYKISNLLTGDAIKYAHCFISYASQNEPFAKRLYNDLQNNGVRCWFAPEDLKRGEFLKTQIDEAIKVHDKLLLILSEESLKSEWVKYEISRARQEELLNKGLRKFFPIRLVDMDVIKGWDWQEDEITGGNLAEYVEQYYIPDLSQEGGV